MIWFDCVISHLILDPCEEIQPGSSADSQGSAQFKQKACENINGHFTFINTQ